MKKTTFTCTEILDDTVAVFCDAQGTARTLHSQKGYQLGETLDIWTHDDGSACTMTELEEYLDNDTDAEILTLDHASYAELFTVGMAVESMKTDFRGTVAEIRYHENRRYIKIDWPTASIWYNEEQAFDNLLVA